VRSAETLGVRVRQANENAAALADWLFERPEVRAVSYPGRADHPDHAVARRIFSSGASWRPRSTADVLR
jgi:cystathionine beta-lyase/cystathionine gamma-synthase